MSERSFYERVETRMSPLGGEVHYIRLKSGKEVSFFDAEREAESALTSVARWTSRMAKLAKAESGEWIPEQYGRHVERIEEYVRALRYALDNEAQRKDTLRRLAIMLNPSGRTEPEIDASRALARKIEDKAIAEGILDEDDRLTTKEGDPGTDLTPTT